MNSILSQFGQFCLILKMNLLFGLVAEMERFVKLIFNVTKLESYSRETNRSFASQMIKQTINSGMELKILQYSVLNVS
jgi:hypothetical protein